MIVLVPSVACAGAAHAAQAARAVRARLRARPRRAKARARPPRRAQVAAYVAQAAVREGLATKPVPRDAHALRELIRRVRDERYGTREATGLFTPTS